jgi:hypothetical protein
MISLAQPVYSTGSVLKTVVKIKLIGLTVDKCVVFCNKNRKWRFSARDRISSSKRSREHERSREGTC